jgi:hypothetical protein
MDMEMRIFLFKVATGELRETFPRDCPDNVGKLIKWCWQQEPKDRPTAVEVLNELELDLGRMNQQLAGLKL